jgi:hypothetical protein
MTLIDLVVGSIIALLTLVLIMWSPMFTNKLRVWGISCFLIIAIYTVPRLLELV